MSLLSETLDFLKKCNKTPDDVAFINLPSGKQCGWEDFATIADFEYDDGFGHAYVQNIQVVGDNWWLERWEYDGSEGWDYKQRPLDMEKRRNKNVNIHDILGAVGDFGYNDWFVSYGGKK